jgi:hypothetical protein
LVERDIDGNDEERAGGESCRGKIAHSVSLAVWWTLTAAQASPLLPLNSPEKNVWPAGGVYRLADMQHLSDYDCCRQTVFCGSD